MPQALTQAKVDKATTTTRALIADGSCRGLYLDVRPTGKSYRYRYTQACGQQRTGNIGDASILKLSEARQLTRELIHKRLMGENIIPQKKPPQPPRVTMGEFIHKRYISHGRVTKRCFDSEISTIRTHILPAFGHRLMSEITKAEITSFIHDKIPTGLAPGTINKILNAVKSIYARAVEWEAAGLEKNPAHGIKQLPDHPRHEKFLTQDEASRLLGAVATSQNKMVHRRPSPAHGLPQERGSGCALGIYRLRAWPLDHPPIQKRQTKTCPALTSGQSCNYTIQADPSR
jgi:hypothetical protein